jgi:DNA-binding NarL/FixJ family response regulator
MSLAGRPRILIAHEQDVIRTGFTACIRSSRRASVVAVAGDADLALQQALRLHPDIGLTSSQLYMLSGEPLLCLLRRACPSLRLIAIVRAFSLEGLAEALRAGAVGVVDEGCGAEVLLESITAAGQSRNLLTGPTASVLLDRLQLHAAVRLTARQRQVLALLAESLTPLEIAERLGIRPATVRLHVRHLLPRLGVVTPAQAVSLARRLGIVRMD